MKLDTLRFAKQLTETGLTEAQAEAIVRGVADADTSDLVTKADLASLGAATKADIAGLAADIAQVRADVKADMAEQKAELFRFLYLQAATIIGLTVALIKLLPG
jgi:hypothetical protein